MSISIASGPSVRRVLEANSFVLVANFPATTVKVELSITAQPINEVVATGIVLHPEAGQASVDLSGVIADYFRSKMRTPPAFITNATAGSGYVDELGQGIQVSAIAYELDGDGLLVQGAGVAPTSIVPCILSGDIITDNSNTLPRILTTFDGIRTAQADDIMTFCTADQLISGFTVKAISHTGSIINTQSVSMVAHVANRPLRYCIVGPSLFGGFIFDWTAVAEFEITAITGGGIFKVKHQRIPAHYVRVHWVNEFAGHESETIVLDQPIQVTAGLQSGEFTFPAYPGDEQWKFSLVTMDDKWARWLSSMRRSGVVGTDNSPLIWLELPTDAGPRKMLPATITNDVQFGGSGPYRLEFNLLVPVLSNSIQ